MVPVGWLRPPRAAVEKVEALLDLGRSPAAIRAHHTMLAHHDDITLEQIEDIRADWEAARDWEVRRPCAGSRELAPRAGATCALTTDAQPVWQPAEAAT